MGKEVKMQSKKNKDIRRLQKKIIPILKKNNVVRAGIFGSYAENKQTKESDLDIRFLIEKKQTEKRLKPYFNEVKLNYSVNVDEHYVTFSDFLKMLLREEENMGKQIFRKHMLFYNEDIYYQLIKEAYKNGFRP